MVARSRARVLSWVACLLLLSSSAPAHIDLLYPEPRTSGRFSADVLDVGPCGSGGLPRAERVSVFRPGETVSVAWDAFITHPGYFRLSFDVDGDDSFSARPSMPGNPALDDPTRLPPNEGEIILDYVEDRAGALDHVEHEVTLPGEPCQSCTLQLIQFAYGLPLREATYHQCADIVLEGEPIEPPRSPQGACAIACRVPGAGRPGAALALALLSLLALRRRSLPAPV